MLDMKRLGQLIAKIFARILLVLWDLSAWLAPQLWRRSTLLRAKIGQLFRYLWTYALKKPFGVVVCTVGIAIVGVNGVVRWQGGGPGWFAVSHLHNKWFAVGRLVLHAPIHSLSSCTHDVKRIIARAAKYHRVPPALVEVIAFTESRFRPHVISSSGAMGVMQLMPATAHQMGVLDPFSAEQNIFGGTKYLAVLWRRYGGDVHRIAAAYHAGPHGVPQQGSLHLGPRTTHYAQVVARRYAKRQPARDSASDHP
ncbi:MAG: transglycosylase SLT domain-containing protein [Myxococcales bacterium]|nr:transglycosylase SLT domain-containing protein [Myxococcales bacterium]